MDMDYHKIYDSFSNCINKDKPIIIGNNIWFGCRSLVLKGTNINDGNVISAGLKLRGHIDVKNSIVATNPLKTIKSDIYWEM